MSTENTNYFFSIKEVQFGQPYDFNGEQFLSDADGVHLGIILDGRQLFNARLSPEEAFEVAKHLSIAAHNSAAARMRGEGQPVTREALESFGKDS